MIAGAVIGEAILIAGLGWFAWQSLADSCIDSGGRVVGMACQDLRGTLEPFAAEWHSPFFLALVAFALASTIGTIAFVWRAARRTDRRADPGSPRDRRP